MKFKLLFVLLLALLSASLRSQEKDLLDIMKEELEREVSFLFDHSDLVYFLSYSISDVKNTAISATNGSITFAKDGHDRNGRVDLRIGDYSRDNTRVKNNAYAFSYEEGLNLPVENNEEAIKYALWSATRAKFLEAKQQYTKLSSEEDKKKSADFSKEEPDISKPLVAHGKDPDIDKWSGLLKELSLMFVSNENIVDANVNLTYSDEIKYFVSSEGTQVREKLNYAHLFVSASIRTEDDLIPYSKSYFAFTPEELPKREALIEEINGIIKTLEALSEAPNAEPYSGPAILSPEVAGVFFHEIFGHRIEGHRLRNESDGQTFKDKIGEKVLTEDISVYSDPTKKYYEKTELSGFYSHDDQGVKAQRVEVVKDGYLKTFLMSRSPLEAVSSSNGHGRATTGLSPVSRQSNLIIESKSGVEDQALRAMLIEECKKTGKPYGYYFKEVTGGYTQTDRYSPNAFNIDPLIVYKVYADGRPDELVKGVNLIGTPLLMFGQIKATGLDKATFNGFCGAESGYIPVSATSPALFVQRIETQKKPIVKPPKTAILKNPVLETLKEKGK